MRPDETRRPVGFQRERPWNGRPTIFNKPFFRRGFPFFGGLVPKTARPSFSSFPSFSFAPQGSWCLAPGSKVKKDGQFTRLLHLRPCRAKVKGGTFSPPKVEQRKGTEAVRATEGKGPMERTSEDDVNNVNPASRPSSILRSRSCGGGPPILDWKNQLFTNRGSQLLVLLVVRPRAPSSFLLLVAMPGAPSSALAPSSKARSP